MCYKQKYIKGHYNKENCIEFDTFYPGEGFSYTYKNISNTESVYISDMDFQIIDEEGVIGDTYPNSISQYPQYITKGITCQAEMVLGVNNRSNVIQLQYRDNMFDDQPIAIFKLNV